MLTLAGSAKPARGFAPPIFADEFVKAVNALAGGTPLLWTVLIWLAAAAGLAILVWRGRRQATAGVGFLVLLLVLVTFSSWLSFPQVAKSHFYAPRYVFVGVVAVGVGLGALAAWAWRAGRGKTLVVGRVMVVLALAGLATIWVHPWRVVYTQPRMAITRMFAPVVQYSTPDEVLLIVPDWQVSLKTWYRLGKARLMRGPSEARYGTSAPVDPTNPSKAIKPFDVDFADLYGPGRRLADIPPRRVGGDHRAPAAD